MSVTEPICLTSQAIFDLKRTTVIALDVKKSEAQGLRGACNSIPDRQTYYLQDPVDYYGNKWEDSKQQRSREPATILHQP